jgi:transposase
MKVFREPVVPQDQLMLLPPSIDDLMAEDEPVRAISEIIDVLDCSCLRQPYGGGGAPAYDPVMLFKAMVFGLSQGLRSSRELADSFRHDTRFIYLARLSHPSYRTICRFRRQNEGAIGTLLVETVLLAQEMGLVLLEHVSVDGTKIEAAGSKREYYTEDSLNEQMSRIAQKIADILAQMEQNDARDESRYGDDLDVGLPEALRKLQDRRAHLERVKAEMEARGLRALIRTDPESRMMKTKGGTRPCVNGQAAVDARSQIILAAEVVQTASDAHQLRPMLDRVEQTLGELPQTVTADGGYWSKDSLDYADERQLDAYIAPGGHKEDALEGWTYEPSTDTYRSAQGDVYRFLCIRRSHGRAYRVYQSRKPRRQKWVALDTDQMARMREKVRSAAGRAIYKLRQVIVEPVFGHLKGAFRLRRLLLRGLSGARFEFFLACITHNLGKIIGSWAAWCGSAAA